MGDQGEEGRPARAALYRSTVRLDQNPSIVASGASQAEEGGAAVCRGAWRAVGGEDLRQR